jgi:hypothetical protein
MKRLKEGGMKEKYEILSTCFYFSPSLNSSQTDRQSPVPVGNERLETERQTEPCTCW